MAPRKRQLAGPIRPGETDAQFRAKLLLAKTTQ